MSSIRRKGINVSPSAGEHESDGLTSLRARLDEIDLALLDVLRDRLQCCLDIAEYKRVHGVSMMQPHRIGVVHERAAAYAATHDMNPEFLRSLYDLVIDEMCRAENEVIYRANSLPPSPVAKK